MMGLFISIALIAAGAWLAWLDLIDFAGLEVILYFLGINGLLLFIFNNLEKIVQLFTL